METQVDKFGRIVIPKRIRTDLGLKSGSVLYVEEHHHEIVLKVAEPAFPIKVEGGVAVYTGQAVTNIESAVQNDREERLKKIGGF